MGSSGTIGELSKSESDLNCGNTPLGSRQGRSRPGADVAFCSRSDHGVSQAGKFQLSDRTRVLFQKYRKSASLRPSNR